MRPLYDAIYLSPHLDDAALSCGGQIYELTAAGRRVLILTLMAGDLPAGELTPFVQSLHERWQLAADAVATRRAEDVAACQILGAERQHWNVPDCIYRLDPQTGATLYSAEADIFGPVHPAESALVAQLAEWMRALPPAGCIVAPLTAGHHVDHQITRAAAEASFGNALAYYEDYPYARRPGALTEVIGSNEGWRSEIIPLSGAALAARCDAIWQYQSQMSTFFSGRADLERQVGHFVRTISGERLWRQGGR